MNHPTTNTPYPIGWRVVSILLLAICLPMSSVSADSPETTKIQTSLVSCTDLSTTFSHDNGAYTFAATAGGSAGIITGYRFDYGDHQSYTATLRPGTTEDPTTAKVTHTYQKFGTYKVNVQVMYKVGNKTAAATSPECQATLTFGPPNNRLPNTGTSAVSTLPGAISIALAAAAAWHIRLRRLATVRATATAKR